MSKIFCLGELLVDMVGTDKKNLKEGKVFEKNAGGAPANVCAAASMLGAETYFMGQVGDDNFGEYLIDKLKALNVDTSMITRGGNTSMAFVSVDENGERDFTFLRDSDEKYDFRNIKTNMVRKEDIIHFGSATGLLEGNLKKTYINFFYFAQENKTFCSFDPNYRDTLLPENNLSRYKRECTTFIKKCDLVKMSEDELFILTDTRDVIEGARILNDIGARVVVITMGKSGSYLSMKNQAEIIPTIPIKQVDATGAGDAFMGGVLYQLSQMEDIKKLPFEKWKEIIRFANVVGGLTTTKYGAMEGIPTLEEVNALLNK